MNDLVFNIPDPDDNQIVAEAVDMVNLVDFVAVHHHLLAEWPMLRSVSVAVDCTVVAVELDTIQACLDSRDTDHCPAVEHQLLVLHFCFNK